KTHQAGSRCSAQHYLLIGSGHPDRELRLVANPRSVPPSIELDIFDASVRADDHHSPELAGLANNSPALHLRNVELLRNGIAFRLPGLDAVLKHEGRGVPRLDQYGSTAQRFGRSRPHTSQPRTDGRQGNDPTHDTLDLKALGRN